VYEHRRLLSRGRVDWRKEWGKCRAFLIGLAWTRLLSMVVVVDLGDGVQYRECGATQA